MERWNDTASYGSVAKGLHWTSAVCVVAAWLLGTFGDDFPKATHPRVLFVHMSLGLAIAALAIGRFGWRFGHPPPAVLDTALGPWGARLATAFHWLLYGLMIAVPIVGIVLQFARGQALPLFGLAEIASPWPRDRAGALGERGARTAGQPHPGDSRAARGVGGLPSPRAEGRHSLAHVAGARQSLRLAAAGDRVQASGKRPQLQVQTNLLKL
jgi:cytochrome b561